MAIIPKSFPKQFLPINTNGEKTLLQKTFQRLMVLENLSDPILVCNENIDL